MPKDIFGKELMVGDMIILHPDITPKLINAKITEVQGGGIAIPTGIGGQKAMSAGQIKAFLEITINFNPTLPINVIKISGGTEPPAGNA